MTMLHDVYADLHGMSQVQLLLAFLAFTGYLFAEGQLMPSRARAAAAMLAVLCAAAFVISATQWTTGIMLVVLAVGSIGVFTAVVWGISAMLGLRRAVELATPTVVDEAPVIADRRLPAIARPEPLHSH